MGLIGNMRHDHLHVRRSPTKAHPAVLCAFALALIAAASACNPERLVIVQVENSDIAEAMIETLQVSTSLRQQPELVRVTRDGGMVKFPVEIGIYIPRSVGSLAVTILAMDRDGMVVGHGTTVVDQQILLTNPVHLCPGPDGNCPEPPPPVDAGCTTGDDGGVVADGGTVDPGPPSAQCVDYCARLMDPDLGCPELYPSLQVCQAVCTLDPDADLSCRLNELSSRPDHPKNCAGAAIVSSTTCDPPCVSYCNLWDAICADFRPGQIRPDQRCYDICISSIGSSPEALACRSGWLARATLNRIYCDWALPALRCGAECP
jgi:hypothetical protein